MTMTRSNRRLISRLNADQRQGELFYANIDGLESLRYCIPFEDTVCFDTVIEDSEDLFFRQCPGSSELWIGDVLILRALYNFGNEDGDGVWVPSENQLKSVADTFGDASGSAVIEFDSLDGCVYFCDLSERIAQFDPATRILKSAGFKYSASGLANQMFLVRDGEAPSTYAVYADIDSTIGFQFGLTFSKLLTQAEVLAL